jgi:NAD(P)-dependent dehydrogenase (short-subunit alcohol dehydrogenase family)
MGGLDRFSLDGRCAIVAGGSGGIGVQACAALASAGTRVVVVGRSVDRMELARRAVEARGATRCCSPAT